MDVCLAGRALSALPSPPHPYDLTQLWRYHAADRLPPLLGTFSELGSAEGLCVGCLGIEPSTCVLAV